MNSELGYFISASLHYFFGLQFRTEDLFQDENSSLEKKEESSIDDHEDICDFSQLKTMRKAQLKLAQNAAQNQQKAQ